MLASACASRPAKKPTAAKPAAPPASVVAATYPQAPARRLTPDLVISTIRDRYLSGVERCYTRHAKALGSANDRIVVSFTVAEDGKTREGNARGITKRVDRCITAQVARWTFPAPREESAFSLGLQLSTN
jgi:hypothetical protein